MISQIGSCGPARLITSDGETATLNSSDLNELNKLNKLYRSTELSNKSAVSYLLDEKDKHDRTSTSGCFVIVNQADLIVNDIRNSAMPEEGSMNEVACQAGSCSVSSSSTGSNRRANRNVSYNANDKSDDKTGHAADQDSGHRMINERSDEIKSCRLMNKSNEFASKNTYKTAGCSSDPLDSSTRSTDYPSTSSTYHPLTDHSSRHSLCYSSCSFSDYHLTDELPALDYLANKSENFFNPATSSLACPTGLDKQIDSSKPMDLPAKPLIVNRKTEFPAFSYALLLTAHLLICGPISASAGKPFRSSCHTFVVSLITRSFLK